jgi:hypothetical protein
VTVVSTLATQPPMIADELRRQADQFIDLRDLEADIGRASNGRPGRTNPRPEPEDDEPDYYEDDEDDLDVSDVQNGSHKF